MKKVKFLFKWVAILIVVGICVTYIIEYYNNYKNQNEWSMLYTNSKSPSCEVSSGNINGTQLIYRDKIEENMRDANISNSDKYIITSVTYISLNNNVIQENKCLISVNGKEKELEAYWVPNGNLQCFGIDDELLKGNDVTLSLMKTNGENLNITYKGNDSFLEKTKKCDIVMRRKKTELNQTATWDTPPTQEELNETEDLWANAPEWEDVKSKELKEIDTSDIDDFIKEIRNPKYIKKIKDI